MLNWPIDVGIEKNSVPTLVVIFLFLLYPIMLYFGYAGTLLLHKNIKGHGKVLKETKTYKHVKSRKPAEEPEFYIARGSDVRRVVEETIEKLGGITSFVKPNERVLIKVNICGGIPDNKGSFTSKEVVGCVIDLIADKAGGGNSIIICDADMIWTKFDENAREMKWFDWVDKKKADLQKNRPSCSVDLINLSDTNLAYFNFKEDEHSKEGTPFYSEKGKDIDTVSTELLNAHVIISIPKMKTHLLTGVTLGMKNMYGTFPEEDKARYHTAGIDEVIYWVNNAFPPNLTRQRNGFSVN
jgi:hypothetical protein